MKIKVILRIAYRNQICKTYQIFWDEFSLKPGIRLLFILYPVAMFKCKLKPICQSRPSNTKNKI